MLDDNQMPFGDKWVGGGPSSTRQILLRSVCHIGCKPFKLVEKETSNSPFVMPYQGTEEEESAQTPSMKVESPWNKKRDCQNSAVTLLEL